MVVPFIFVLWAKAKAKARNLNYTRKFYFRFFASKLLPNYEYSWELLCENNFQYEIKTVTFAFAFCQHEILRRRVKNSFELQQTPPRMEFSPARWFMKPTLTSAADFRAGISHRSITRSHIESEENCFHAIGSFFISIIHSSVMAQDLILIWSSATLRNGFEVLCNFWYLCIWTWN